MGDDSERGVADASPGQGDRFWILLDIGERGARPEGAEEPARRTLVVRDGDKVLISVPVGRGSPLAVPLRIDQLPHVGARLVVRLASETTPCARCVDERLAAACEDQGGLDAAGILRAVHAALNGCAALARVDPGHGVAPAPAAPAGSLPTRGGVPLRLAPPNEPHVGAGGALADGNDADLLLII